MWSTDKDLSKPYNALIFNSGNHDMSCGKIHLIEPKNKDELTPPFIYLICLSYVLAINGTHNDIDATENRHNIGYFYPFK